MPGNISFGGSVIKREARPKQEVERKFSRDGWTKTGEIGGVLSYFEKSGVNMTIMKGAMGTLIFPSGPVRGNLFAQDNALFSTTSVIGAGKNSSSNTQKNPKKTRRSNTTLN